MVVALDLEGDRLSLSEVDDARIFPWPLQDAGALGRKAAQERRRVLVAAVLGPEKGENGQLEVVRVTAQQTPDAVEFPVGQAERAV
jgi:hypothetical protein